MRFAQVNSLRLGWLNGFGFAKKIDRQINLVKEPRANRVASTYALQGFTRKPCGIDLYSEKNHAPSTYALQGTTRKPRDNYFPF